MIVIDNQSNDKSYNQESQSYQPGQDSNNADQQDHLTDEQRAANGQVNDKYEERKDDAQDVQKSETKYKKLKALLTAQNDMKPEKADIESALKDTTKYDIIVDESKQRLNMIFLGHVDSGKATICGSILRLTGQLDENMIKELEQESKNFNRPFWLTYLLHIPSNNTTLKTASYPKFDTTKKRVTILDTPGFKNYHHIINNSKAEIACLVVSARPGEFEAGFEKGGQTTEYALLTKNLGVRDLIVLVNKMDDNQIGWSQERYEHIKTKLAPFLRDSCGYDLEKNVYWLPISAQNGDNMMIHVGTRDPRGSWYTGATFFKLLDDIPVTERDPEGPVRIPVVDKFQDGNNLNVISRVENGTITYGKVELRVVLIDEGMQLTVVPNGEALTIDTIYNYDDQRIPYAKPGENVRLTFKNVEDQSISKGDVICSNHSFIYACTEIECEINILSLPQHKPIISPGYTCVLHIHAAIIEVTITAIKAEVDKAATKLKPVRFLKSGSVGIVRLARTDNNAICCEKFEKNSYLGGFVFRDEGMTIAFGKVLRVKPI